MVALSDVRRSGEHPSSADPSGVSWSDGVVRLKDRRLFADPAGEPCRDFLRRIFRLEEVRSVEIDPSLGQAMVRHALGEWDIDRVLGRMSSTLRDEPAPAAGSALPAADISQPIVRVSRYGSVLSSWEVVHEIPGRLRLRHEGLRKVGPLAEQVQSELLAVEGIRSCSVNPWTGSLLIHHDPQSIAPRQILRILDHIVEGSALALAHEGHPPSVRFGLANASVALAVAGEFAVPALLPASALLLIASNTRTFRAAWLELERRQPGLPLLTTAIVGVTLVSGQFLAAALMGWSFKFWHRRHRDRLHATRRALLPALAQQRRFARLWTETAELEVTLDMLQVGDLIVVAAGEAVPADGRVVRGTALIDERPIRGGYGSTIKREGDRVYAGTRLASGDLRVEVEAVGGSTRLAGLARALHSGSAHALSPHAITAEGEAFARRAVLPTLATAGLGLLTLDLAAAAAVLRPDYATGPGLGVSLETLLDSSRCAREGILIRDPSAFRRLAEADILLFDDHPDLARRELEVSSIDADDLPRVLRLAKAALRGLDDERAGALRVACRSRSLVRLEISPEYGDTGISVSDEGGCATVSDAPDGTASLVVEIEGRPAGRIAFARGDHHQASSAFRFIQGSDPWAVGLISGLGGPEVASLAGSLGIEHFRGNLDAEAKASLLRALRDRGLNVAYVGDCRREAAVAREAHVAISLADDFDPAEDAGAIVLLRGDLARIAEVRELSLSHVERVRAVHGSALIPNLVCIAGAFFFGFTSLATVIITNLGTLGVYSRLPHRAREAGALPRHRPVARARPELPGWLQVAENA